MTLRLIIVFSILFLSLTSVCCWAVETTLKPAPASIQATLMVKLLSLNKTLNKGGDVTILVLGSRKVAMSMKTIVGTSVGKSTLTRVTIITKVPEVAPQGLTAFYVSDPNKVVEVANYCRKHKIQSMTGTPQLVGKGVTIIVGKEGKHPKILVDMENAMKEGVTFDPAIRRIATIL